MANAAQIAVDEINALGGDVQFTLISEDDVNDAETAVNAYNALMDQGMQILLGTVTTGPALAVVPYAYDERVFTLTPSGSGDDVIEGNDNVFQVCFTDSNQGSRSAQYISENFDDPQIAIIYRNDDAYSQGIRDNFVAEAESRGMSIVYEGTFTEASQTDFNNQLTGAQSAGADMIFLPIYYEPASVILTQANAMGYAPTFFGVDGMDGILTLPGFDTSLAEGVYLLTPFSADAEDEATQSFVAEYQERYGETPNQFAADAYDGVYIIYEAIQAAGVTADMSNEEICDALIAAMGDLSIVGLTSAGSEMTWDENGAVSKDPRRDHRERHLCHPLIRQSEQTGRAAGVFRQPPCVSMAETTAGSGRAFRPGFCHREKERGARAYGISVLSDQRRQPWQHLRHHRPGLHHGLRHRQDE